MQEKQAMKPKNSFKTIDQITLLACALAIMIVAPFMAFSAAPSVRVKDLADIEGVRDNMLIGYGLVVGLAGTGDAANSVPFTRQSLVNMLERLGVNSKEAEANLKMKNVAAVMVTARMPSLARQGGKLDVIVSSLGDSKSLEGGTLLATPLMGADGNTYAVAQGSLIVGGFTAEGNAGAISKNHSTAARIADGAIVERETGFELSQLGDSLRLILKNPDFTTAKRVRDALNKRLGAGASIARDDTTVDVKIKDQNDIVSLIDLVETTRVTPDSVARVIIDEKTGTIVMGEEVRISDVAISHSNLTIRVNELAQVSQPGAFADGETATVDRSAIDIDSDGTGKFIVMETGTNLADLVNGLNNLGVKPRDIISILQNIKAVGAMQADLVIM
jgi:flagellar P-ring protein precursor FlgI